MDLSCTVSYGREESDVDTIIILYCDYIILHDMILSCTILYYFILYHVIIMYCIILYDVILYYIALHYIILLFICAKLRAPQLGE